MLMSKVYYFVILFKSMWEEIVCFDWVVVWGGGDIFVWKDYEGRNLCSSENMWGCFWVNGLLILVEFFLLYIC